MKCAPTRSVTVLRGDSNGQNLRADANGYKMIEKWIVDENITTSEVIDLVTNLDGHQAILVHVFSNTEPYRMKLWTKAEGYKVDANGVFYKEMNKLREGREQYSSELNGDYVVMTVFEEL